VFSWPSEPSHVTILLGSEDLKDRVDIVENFSPGPPGNSSEMSAPCTVEYSSLSEFASSDAAWTGIV
jgi:hypothetical protein